MLNKFRANRLAEELLTPDLQYPSNARQVDKVIEALDSIANGKAYAADRLAHIAGTSTGERRESAIRMLTRIEVRAADVSLLVGALEDTSPGIRRVAAEALAKKQLEPQKIMPALAARLTDSDQSVREAAIRGLGGYGRAASAFAPQIEAVLSDLGLTEKTARVLYSIGKESLSRDVRVRCRIIDEASYHDWGVEIDSTCRPIVEDMLMGNWRGSWDRALVYKRALETFVKLEVPLTDRVRTKLDDLVRYSSNRGDGVDLDKAQMLAKEILKRGNRFRGSETGLRTTRVWIARHAARRSRRGRGKWIVYSRAGFSIGSCCWSASGSVQSEPCNPVVGLAWVSGGPSVAGT